MICLLLAYWGKKKNFWSLCCQEYGGDPVIIFKIAIFVKLIPNKHWTGKNARKISSRDVPSRSSPVPDNENFPVLFHLELKDFRWFNVSSWWIRRLLEHTSLTKKCLTTQSNLPKRKSELLDSELKRIS